MIELIETLNLQAQEIAAEGHAGWGNTMADAARELKGLHEAFRMLNRSLERQCTAMQAAVAEAILSGDKAGMEWIINTLDGPGLLPDIEAVKAAGGAQAWFSAEIAAHD